MKIQKYISAVLVVCVLLTSCKTESKKTDAPKVELAANTQKVSLNISGMTCEIGCAKTIQSKLSKKAGVLEAKVVFKDSIANIEYDANKTSKKDLIAFVDGIADGGLYKASECAKKAHICKENCKKECDTKSKKTCSTECKKECCIKETEKKA
ncbi:heavy-metal-associated domain-containing protein [Lutibacter sp. Hel_I_33_5]|nr:heavy-metal-associated domain-containing protein [Lutibacter sp. Hel_I_33_5]